MLSFDTFEERFRYLALHGGVGDRTFGGERYLNQAFYTSAQWRRTRNEINIRDNGCDMAMPGHEIHGTYYIHHINPLRPEDLKNFTPALLNPENLVVVSLRTHNAIHYGDETQIEQPLVERGPGDTKDW
jgi:hypothetical protein